MFGKNSLSNGLNGGYDYFETEQELNNQIECEKLSREIYKQFSFPGCIEKLGFEKVKAIADIMGVKSESDYIDIPDFLRRDK